MRILISILLFLLINGCGGISAVPNDHYYRLPEPSVLPESNVLVNGVIFVEQFIADGLHRERSILYTKGSPTIELGQYHYHHWIESPTRLLQDHLIDYLRALSAAPQVMDQADVPSELQIYGKIRQFERQDSGHSGYVNVSLEFRVNQSDQDIPILIKGYSAQIKTDNQSMHAAVMAFDKALSAIFSDLLKDIKISKTDQ